jgi:hypothetical protein
MDFLRASGSPRLRFWIGVVTLVAAAACARPAAAQVFSPGELIQAHKELDSLKSCRKCHSEGDKVDPALCLACHTELRDRIQKKEGYHAAPERSKDCQTCHPDHRGRAAAAVKWPGGKQASFKHQDVGWPLEGAHGKLACEKCHDARHVADPAERAAQAKKAGTTFRGLSRACASCHFDEHRGQLGADCATCHDLETWKPAPKFEHVKFYKLEGAHGKVACDKCHAATPDPKFDAASFPPPRAATFLKMKPVAHGACTDCHQDPHQNRMGADCTACHTQTKWTEITRSDKLDFHDKTAYPLKGRHRLVECAACHPANKQGQKHLKPIAHDTCSACHPNAHPDLPEKSPAAECSNCHTVDGYLPVRYTAADHETTRYPLKDAHRAAACPDCHLKKLGDPLAAVKTPVAKFLAPQAVSPWRLRAKGKTFDACTACHTKGHRDQFAPRDCAVCHTGQAWTPAPRFNHDKTRYKLEGPHRKAACQRCHGTLRDAEGPFVRYRNVPFADCAPCHGDVHYGQFRQLAPTFACAQCHEVSAFTKVKFTHKSAAFSDFPLAGAHDKAACARCHPKVRLAAPGAVTDTVRYRPTPKDCELCHEDEHQGKYREASRLLSKAGDPGFEPMPEVSEAAVTAAVKADSWAAPQAWFSPLRENPTRCAACHAESSWRKVRFSHDVTGFPLRGSHVAAACGGCHKGVGKDAPARECTACHADVHRGELGRDCAACHDETDFRRPVMPLARHAQTSFPLEGAHAVAPCAECHRNAVDAGFRSAPRQCLACHAGDVPRASASVPSHAGFSPNCGQCHTAVDWRAASYLAHDRCFPIGPTTHHAGYACSQCHTRGIPPATPTCGGSGVSCMACHGSEAARHAEVNGYEAKDRKCYECHSGGSE